MSGVAATPWSGPIIDAHHHVWDPATGRYPWLRPGVLKPHRYGDYTAIKRRYEPQDYRRDAAGQSIAATVYVEAEWDPDDPLGETRAVTQVAERHGLPNAMAAQAWLDREDVAEVLAAQAAFPLVRSIRHKPGGPESPRERAEGGRSLMADEGWRRGYALLERHGLHFELQTPWWNLPDAVDLARAFPAILMIVNHAGVPGPRDPATLDGWRRALAALAALPNVAIKVSGLFHPGVVTAAGASQSLIRDVVGLFGASRVMFGSNYPVDALFASFGAIFAAFKAATAQDGPEDQRAMFLGNALRIYRPVRLTEAGSVAIAPDTTLGHPSTVRAR